MTLVFTEAIIVFSTALFVYWAMRSFLLLVGSEEHVAQVLENDRRRLQFTLGI